MSAKYIYVSVTLHQPSTIKSILFNLSSKSQFDNPHWQSTGKKDGLGIGPKIIKLNHIDFGISQCWVTSLNYFNMPQSHLHY